MDALSSNHEILRGCQNRYPDSLRSRERELDRSVLADFPTQLRELEAHGDTISSMLKYSQGTGNFVIYTAVFIQPTAKQDHPSSDGSSNIATMNQYRYTTQAWTRLSADLKVATELTARLSKKTAGDSSLLKALTTLATLYLPPTLIAVCSHQTQSIVYLWK